MDYTIVKSANIEDFEKQVNKLLHLGYHLAGGMLIVGSMFLQAMIKP